MRALFSQPPEELPIVFGHRGYSSRAPENTLASFRLIHEHAVAAAELDVHCCASGEVVVIHDHTLERTGGAPLSIGESTLSELREHSVGSFFGDAFEAERIPLLTDVFDLLGSDHYIDIEIKPHGDVRGPAHPHSVEWETVRIVRERGLVSHVVVSSFDPRIIRRIGVLAPEIHRAVIYADTPEMPWFLRHGFGARIGRATVLKPQWSQVNSRMMLQARRRGLSVIPWTVDDPEEAVRLARMGVTGIITNKPGEIRSALGQ